MDDVKNKTTSLDEGFGEKEINKIRLSFLKDPLIKFDLTGLKKLYERSFYRMAKMMLKQIIIATKLFRIL